MSENMFVSVSPLIILAVCTKCFFMLYAPEHDGMDPSVDSNDQVWKKDEMSI